MKSWFKPGDLRTNQHLSIRQEIYKTFDCWHEVNDDSLDISKAFDDIWHVGVTLKLEQNNISGNWRDVIQDFLDNLKQNIVLNGQVSSWASIKAGVPPGLILGWLFYLI